MVKRKISSFQFLILVIFFTVGTSILVVPSSLAMDSKQDAWISAIVGTLFGSLIIWFYTSMALWFPSLTYVQLNEKILGKWLGKFTSILFICMCLLFVIVLISYAGYFLNTVILPRTPMQVINVLNCIVLVIAVRLGLETFSKAAEIFIFVFLFLLLVLVTFLIPEIDVKNIQPLFQASSANIATSSLKLIAVSSMNAIALLMIFPVFVKNHKTSRTCFLLGNILGGIIIIVITALCIFVLGPNITTMENYPSYEMAKQINIGEFVSRIEAFMAELWVIGLFFKSIIYFFAALVGISQIFQLKNYQSLTYPLGMIVCVFSFTLFANFNDQQDYSRSTDISLSIVICLFIPIILTIVYFIRKNHLKKEDISDQKAN